MRKEFSNSLHFDRLDEFWAKLAPERSQFPNALYRGQAEAEWDLRPSILRSKLPGAEQELRTASSLFGLERELLGSFVKHCDLEALDTRCSASVHRIMSGGRAHEYPDLATNWPTEDVRGLLALAQHHGLPTRLLDWTRCAHKAAYFAASGVKRDLREGEQRNGNLAVWILDRDGFDEYENEWGTVRVPGSNSANLAAQEGEFTFRIKSQSEESGPLPLALDAFFAGKKHSPLYKLTAPKGLAGEILRRCQQYGISGVNLFPDYYGAVRSTLELYSGILSSLRLSSREK